MYSLFIYESAQSAHGHVRIHFITFIKKQWTLNVHRNTIVQRWEFIKENKKVKKQELDQESDQEKKKTRTRPRKKEKTFFFS